MTAPQTPPPPPSFVRPVLALLAGLGIAVIVVVVGSVLAALALLPNVGREALEAAPSYLAATLVLSIIGGSIGGYVTARLTPNGSYYTVVLLAALLLASGLGPALRQGAPNKFPEWYMFGIAVLAPAGVLVGGLIERRRSRGSRVDA